MVAANDLPTDGSTLIDQPMKSASLDENNEPKLLKKSDGVKKEKTRKKSSDRIVDIDPFYLRNVSGGNLSHRAGIFSADSKYQVKSLLNLN